MSDNLKKMGKQIGNLRGQMRKIKTLMMDNAKEIEQNLKIARKAKEMSNNQQLTLATRKAARLRDSNEKYEKLHKKMGLLYKVLTKMYANSEILLEDTKRPSKSKGARAKSNKSFTLRYEVRHEYHFRKY